MKKALLILVILILAVIGQSQSGLAEGSEIEVRPGYQTLRGQIHDIGTGEAPILVFKTDAGSYLVSNARAGSNHKEDAGNDDSFDASIDDSVDTSAGDNVDARKLASLKGLPLLLTGRVNLLNGGSFLGQITVEDYNTYYDGSSDSSGDDSSNGSINDSSDSSSDTSNDDFSNSTGDNSSDDSGDSSGNDSSNSTGDSSSYNTWEEVAILGKLVDGGDNLVLLARDQLVVELAPDSYHSLDKYLGEEVVITGSLEKFDDYSGQMEVKSYKVLPGD